MSGPSLDENSENYHPTIMHCHFQYTCILTENGGSYRIRICDLHDVNVTL